MNSKNLCLSLLFFLLFYVINAQVGIGTTTPDNSTILDITATDKGVLIPRVSLVDVTDITTPVNNPTTGLLVYNTNASVTGGSGEGFYYFNGTIWVIINSKDDQNLLTPNLTGTTLNLGIENGTGTSINLATLQDGTGTDDQTIDNLSLSGTTLRLSLENDGQPLQTVNLASLQDGTGTDDQNLTTASLTGTTLNLGIESGTGTSVNLAALQDGIGTDDQTIDNLSLSGTTLRLSLENDGQPIQTVNLASLQDGTGTDDQNIQNLAFNASTNILTVGIESGASQTVNLSALDSRGDIIQVNAGTGLTGGGTTGNITLNAVGTNGLTTNADDIRLGGTLIENTTISQGIRSFDINLNSTGDFAIQDNGTDVFFVEDSGDVGFGNSNPTYKVHVTENTAAETRAIYVDKDDNTTNPTEGIYVAKTSNGTGRNHGYYANVNGTGNGNRYGVYTDISGTGTGQKYGIFNELNSNTAGSQYAVRNWVRGESGNNQFGVFNNMDSANTADIYGVYNGMRVTNASNMYGVYNEFLTANSSTTLTAGIRNRFTGGTPGAEGFAGIYTDFDLAEDGTFYGVRNQYSNTSTGTGTKYGSYNIIPSGAGGTHYGVYSNVTKSGSYAGYFLGRLSVGTTAANSYIFPASRGTNGQVITTNGAGILSFSSITQENTTASNGITETGNDIRLGGTLTQDTNINYGNFDTRFNLNNQGDFIIQDNGTGVFEINDVGTTTIGRDMVWRDTNTSGTIIGQMLDDGDDARFILRENGAISVDLDTNTQFVFNEQGLNRDFRVESDNNTDMLRIDASADRVGIAGVPDIDFHVFHGNNGNASGMKLQNTNNNNWIRMYVSSGTGDLRFYSTSQGTTSISNINDVSGVYTATSDRRLKKDFKNLYFSWDTFMELQPLTYKYKADNESKNYIGMVAQDVEKIYPELISYDKEEDVYHMDYSATGVIAIKATQKLKQEVKELNLKMETLIAENKTLKQQLSKLEQLETRLLALEEDNSNKKASENILSKK